MEITKELLDKKLTELENERQVAAINLGRADGAIMVLKQILAYLGIADAAKDTPLKGV